MNRRQRTVSALGACGLATALGLIAAGCAREETNEEFFERTAPPGVNGPPQSYTAGSGQVRPEAPPATKTEPASSEEAPPPVENAAPKDETPAPTEAPPAPEPPAAPAEDTKG